MRNNLLLSLALTLIISFQAFSQRDVTISGRLVDKDGQPVPGANVYVKGTKLGTVTDADGNYTITVPQGSVLTFAAAGYNERSVKIANQTVINLTMEEEQIEAITVTSYGQVIDKTTTTGAITGVSGKDFETLPMQSFDRAMQGRLAGVAVNAASGAPGGGLTVRIRGVGSVLASNAPLYIIDGVQVNSGGISGQGSSNALGSINPNDIETIEVLKDPASAAIYGAQSANGVVIVTTKRGKKNSDQFNVIMQEGFVEPIRLYDVLRARDYALLKQEAAVNDLYIIGAPAPTQAQINSAIANARKNYGSPDTTVDFSWKRAVFRIARTRMYDISYSGGTDKTRFYISASYQKQEGTVIKNFWERASARFNIDHKPNKRFTLQASNNLSTQNLFGTIAGGEGNFVNSPFMTAFVSAPTYSAYLPDGRFAEYTNGVLPLNYNILQGLEYETRRGNGIQVVSSLRTTYNFLPELSATGFVGVDWLNNRDENIRPAFISVFRPNPSMINRYDRDFAVNTNYTLNYNKKFADKHSVSALVGYEYRYRSAMFTTALGRGFNPYISVLNGASNGTTPTTVSSVSGNVLENDRAGVFTQLRYAFKEKYLVDIVGRRDGSSKFGAKNKYGNFYAVSGAWRISQESFMESIADQISDLKLKASYGIVGNSEIADYQNVTTFSAAGVQYAGQGGLRPNVLGNDLLTWETSAQTNIGVDFGILRNSRISGSIDFWRRDTQDALFSVSLPADAGQRPSSVIRNVGKIRNQGVDFEIRANILTNPEGLQWISAFNITYQQNKVLELPENNNVMVVNIASNVSVEVFKGYPLNTYALPAYAGVNPATGQPMYYDAKNNVTYQPLSYQINPDKSINFRDTRLLGSTIPKVFGGWNNQFAFKGITLDLLWQYQYGNVVYNSDFEANLMSGMQSGGNNVTMILDRWQKPGDVTNVPRLSLSGSFNGVLINTPSSRFIEDASYVRLKTVTLGYNVPSEKLKGLKSARIFVQAVNLLTFTKTNLIDPEVVSTTANPTSLRGGINQYPQGRTFSVGASLGF